MSILSQLFNVNPKCSTDLSEIYTFESTLRCYFSPRHKKGREERRRGFINLSEVNLILYRLMIRMKSGREGEGGGEKGREEGRKRRREKEKEGRREEGRGKRSALREEGRED